MQAALNKEPELGNLPSALDFVSDEADRKVIELYLTQKTLARPIIAPPGIAPERLALLKNAFAALSQDKHFLADAESARLEVAPIWGEAVDRIIRQISSASPETTARLGKVIGSERAEFAPGHSLKLQARRRGRVKNFHVSELRCRTSQEGRLPSRLNPTDGQI